MREVILDTPILSALGVIPGVSSVVGALECLYALAHLVHSIAYPIAQEERKQCKEFFSRVDHLIAKAEESSVDQETAISQLNKVEDIRDTMRDKIRFEQLTSTNYLAGLTREQLLEAQHEVEEILKYNAEAGKITEDGLQSNERQKNILTESRALLEQREALMKKAIKKEREFKDKMLTHLILGLLRFTWIGGVGIALYHAYQVVFLKSPLISG